MAVAYFSAHAPNSFFPILNHGEGAILYCFIFFYLFVAGPGAWSIDAARALKPAAVPPPQ
jgi:putative oxidoreductase